MNTQTTLSAVFLLVIVFRCVLLSREVRRLRRRLADANAKITAAFASTERQVIWKYGDARCPACKTNNWSSCGHRMPVPPPERLVRGV
jgi:hypothetical protein